MLFIIVLALSVLVTSKRIDGTWHNKLHSQMYVEQLPNSPILNGYYNSTVGGTSGTYPLNGLITTQYLNQQIVSFCVTWQNLIADFMSITCWTGVYDYSSQTIESMWMLRRQTSNTWNSTLIGSDTFKRRSSNPKNDFRPKKWFSSIKFFIIEFHPRQ